MTVSDTHADTIRHALDVAHPVTGQDHDDVDAAPAALDALVAEIERERARADRLADALEPVLIYAECERARADRAEQVLEALFTVLPEINGRFFDDAHTAWADGREHEWDEAKFRAAISEAIGSRPIVDVAALRARADRAEAALAEALAEIGVFHEAVRNMTTHEIAEGERTTINPTGIWPYVGRLIKARAALSAGSNEATR